MIQSAESDDPTNYATLAALTEPAIFDLELQRVNFQWATHQGTPGSTVVFDAGVATTGPVRARLSGTSIVVEQLVSGSWNDLSAGITSVDASVAPAVWVDAAVIRVVYYKGGDIQYNLSNDEGSSWSGDTSLDTLANVTHLAPTSNIKLHVATFTNSMAHFYRYDNEVQTESDLYHEEALDSFDAETNGTEDVIVFCSTGATVDTQPRQGVWCYRQIYGRWSDIREVDVIDDYIPSDGTYDGVYKYKNMRSGVRLSRINGLLWATYIATDSDDVGSYERLCYSRSLDGRFWQLRQYFGTATEQANLCRWGIYDYLVNGEGVDRSNGTVLTGHPQDTIDITSLVLPGGYRFRRARMHQSEISVTDENGVLDALITSRDRYRVVEQVGYEATDGTRLLQTIALTELEDLEFSKRLPDYTKTLSCRDYLCWLTDWVHAPEFETWDSQLHIDDDFDDLGMVAQKAGSWDTVSNELVLSGDGVTDSFALSTQGASGIGHTIWQACIWIDTNAALNYVGLVFRSDAAAENCWIALYQSYDDQLKLYQWSGGDTFTVRHTGATMSWSTSTWYKLRVEARGPRISVYYSTYGSNPRLDCVWTLAFTYLDTTPVDYKEGMVGYAGLTTSECKFRASLLMDGDKPVTIEDAVMAVSEYADIHDFEFDATTITWDTVGATGTWAWNQVTNQIDGTGGGAAQWYWMYGTEDMPESFVFRVTKDIDRGAIRFHYGTMGAETVWFQIDWDGTTITVTEQYVSAYTLASIPRAYTGNSNLILSVQRDLSGQGYLSFWMDDRLCLTVSLNFVALTSRKIGLGVYQSDDINYWDARIAELTEELPVVSLDTGKTPMFALAQSLGKRHIDARMRFDGSLRVVRSKASTNTATLDEDDVITAMEQSSRRLAVSHWRQVGAYDIADAHNDSLHQALGHKMIEDNNSEIMHKDDCQVEADEAIVRNEEMTHTLGASYPFNVYSELEDRISVLGDDWILTSDAVSLEAGKAVTNARLREYTY